MSYLKILRYVCPLLLCCVFSCKKHKHGYIHGKVTEGGNSEPIAGATVILKYAKTGFEYQNDTLHTDANGEFRFYRKMERGFEYRLAADAPGHFGTLIDIDRAKPPYSLSLDAFAYLKIRIKKTLIGPTSIAVVVAGNNFFFSNQLPFDTIINKTITVRATKPLKIDWSTTDVSLPNGPQNPNKLDATIIPGKFQAITYLIQYN